MNENRGFVLLCSFLGLTDSFIFCRTYTFVFVQVGTRLLGDVFAGRHLRYIILDIFL